MPNETTGGPRGPNENGHSPLRRLLVRDDGALRLVSMDDVAWIEAAGNYVRVHAAGRVYRIRTPLSALERRLDPDRFARVHRSALVNLDCVTEIAPWSYGDYVVHLDDGTRLKLSRHYRRDLETRFGVEA